MMCSTEPPGSAEAGILHGTSDRARLVAAGMLIVAIIAQRRIEPTLAALVLAFGFAAASRCSVHSIVRRLRHIEGFLVLMLGLLPFTVPGEAIGSIGPFTASWQGLTRAALIVLKVNAAALVMLALVTRLDPGRLGNALSGLGVPAALTQVLVLTVRYVEVFRSEYARLIEAMRARGFVARSNRHTWLSLGNLCGMMLVRALDRAERVEEAMRARGFCGRLALAASAPLNRADYVLLAVTLAVSLGLAGAAWL